MASGGVGGAEPDLEGDATSVRTWRDEDIGELLHRGPSQPALPPPRQLQAERGAGTGRCHACRVRTGDCVDATGWEAGMVALAVAFAGCTFAEVSLLFPQVAPEGALLGLAAGGAAMLAVFVGEAVAKTVAFGMAFWRVPRNVVDSVLVVAALAVQVPVVVLLYEDPALLGDDVPVSPAVAAYVASRVMRLLVCVSRQRRVRELWTALRAESMRGKANLTTLERTLGILRDIRSKYPLSDVDVLQLSFCIDAIATRKLYTEFLVMNADVDKETAEWLLGTYSTVTQQQQQLLGGQRPADQLPPPEMLVPPLSSSSPSHLPPSMATGGGPSAGEKRMSHSRLSGGSGGHPQAGGGGGGGSGSGHLVGGGGGGGGSSSELLAGRKHTPLMMTPLPGRSLSDITPHGSQSSLLGGGGGGGSGSGLISASVTGGGGGSVLGGDDGSPSSVLPAPPPSTAVGGGPGGGASPIVTASAVVPPPTTIRSRLSRQFSNSAVQARTSAAGSSVDLELLPLSPVVSERVQANPGVGLLPQDVAELNRAWEAGRDSTTPPQQPYSGLLAAGDRLGTLNNTLDDWGFNIFSAVVAPTDGHPLAPVLLGSLRRTGVFEEPGLHVLNVDAFYAFAVELERCYFVENAYHNRIHAGDVVQACHHFLTHRRVREALTPLDRMALLVAAACHDVKHPGVSNAFLTATSHRLAVLYNDTSVLENMHVSEAFEIMRTRPECNILAGLPQAVRAEVRETIIQMVLATDMKVHTSVMNDFKTQVVTAGAPPARSMDNLGPQALLTAPVDPDSSFHTTSSAHGMMTSGLSPAYPLDFRRIILKTTLHAADVSNPARAGPLCKRWALLVQEEFFRQGDQEREAGVPSLFFMDRNKPMFAKVQDGFAANIVLPLFETLWGFVPSHADVARGIMADNIAFWKRMLNEPDPMEFVRVSLLTEGHAGGGGGDPEDPATSIASRLTASGGVRAGAMFAAAHAPGTGSPPLPPSGRKGWMRGSSFSGSPGQSAAAGGGGPSGGPGSPPLAASSSSGGGGGGMSGYLKRSFSERNRGSIDSTASPASPATQQPPPAGRGRGGGKLS